MDRSAFDSMAALDERHWWFVARRKILAGLIERQVRPPSGARILEVGAGTGSNLALLMRYGAVDAIEPDDAARALASRRSGLAVRGGLLPNVPLEDGAYDMIAMLDVLEHIPDDHGALTALRPKLKPGGRLLIAVPAAPWMWSDHDVAHHHQRRYTARTLRAVAAGAGYRVRYLTHFNSVLFPLIAAVRIANKARGAQGADDTMPPPMVNGALTRLFASERAVATRVPLPFGVSLGLVAEAG